MTLLERFAPRLFYDLFEPDTAGSIGRIVGELRRTNADPIGRFSPAFLGPTEYADGQEVRRDDYLHLELRHCGPGELYGRQLMQGDATFLQYWIWYGRNGFHWSIDGWHQGDWQSIVLRVPKGAAKPDLAAYAQHRDGEVRPWGDVQKQADHPVVYVDLGSHASRFQRGPRGTGLRASKPLPLVDVTYPQAHPWTLWPGRWGSSRATQGRRWSDSPRGPGPHREWSDPAGWIASLR